MARQFRRPGECRGPELGPVRGSGVERAQPTKGQARSQSATIELKRAQRDVARSQARMRTMLDTVGDAIVTVDEQGHIEEANRAAERMFGYSEGELRGRNVQMLMPEPYKSDHPQHMQRYLSTGEARIIGKPNRELMGQRKDGTTFPMELSIGEWRDGSRRMFTGIVHDITERKEREKALRESEARFRQIAEHIEDALTIIERGTGRMLYASPAFEVIWGRPLSELYASDAGWPDWAHPSDRQQVEAAYASFLKGDPFDQEYRIDRPDGEVRWVRARAFEIYDEDGVVRRDAGLIEDITNRRQLEDELHHAQKMQAVGALASGVAHDFNNVLQAVLGCVNIAQMDGISTEAGSQYLTRAAEAARLGGQLAAQLMAFARKKESDPAPVALDTLLKGTAPFVERLLTEQVSLRIEAHSQGAAIRLDPVQIEQIVMNLAANARDAMPQGGTLELSTRQVAHDDAQLVEGCSQYGVGPDPAKSYVELCARDTGQGVAPEIAARIFEPFFTTKPHGFGTGLGLSNVSRIMKNLGGCVTFESTPGQGTSFRLFFPCVDHGAARLSPVEAPTPQRFHGTALLVEDDPRVRMVVQGYLEQLGMNVLQAADYSEAHALLDGGGRVDVLVTDVVLPGVQGPQGAQLVRERFPDVQVLFMTGNGDVAGTSPPSEEVLRKPFDKAQLAEALSRLQQSRSASE